MAPIDYASKAIVYLSRSAGQFGKVFHLINPHSPSVNQLADKMRARGYEVESITFELWLSQVVEQVGDKPDHALYPLLPVFSEMHERLAAARSLPGSATEGGKPALIQTDWTNTREGLAQSGVSCPSDMDTLLDRYFSYFIQSGFLNEPGRAD